MHGRGRPRNREEADVTKGPKEEVAAQVLDGREGGKILYGGYCTEGGSRKPEEVRNYATGVGAA